MPKFCPRCGKEVTDDITTVCSNCGQDLTKSATTVQNAKTFTATRQQIVERAIPFFSAKKYAVRTQTDYLVAFESQDRDVNWIIFVIFCCLGLIPAAIYYFWFTHNHQVTVSLSQPAENQVTVNAIGNTIQANKDATDFIRSL